MKQLCRLMTAVLPVLALIVALQGLEEAARILVGQHCDDQGQGARRPCLKNQSCTLLPSPTSCLRFFCCAAQVIHF